MTVVAIPPINKSMKKAPKSSSWWQTGSGRLKLMVGYNPGVSEQAERGPGPNVFH